MLLYADGLGVAHVTLHMALRDVFRHLTRESIREKIELLDDLLPRLLGRRPRIGVAGLQLALREINRPSVEPTRRAGLEPGQPEATRGERIAERFGNSIPGCLVSSYGRRIPWREWPPGEGSTRNRPIAAGPLGGSGPMVARLSRAGTRLPAGTP